MWIMRMRVKNLWETERQYFVNDLREITFIVLIVEV